MTDNFTRYLKESEEIINYLKESRLFNHLPEDKLQKLVPLSELSRVPSGTVILREGEQNDKVFFLLQGQWAVYSGEELIIKLKRKGDIIGEMSVISDKPCTATVITETPVELFSIRAKDIGKYTDLDTDDFQNVLYRIFAMIMTEKLTLTTHKAKFYEKERQRLQNSQSELQQAYQMLDTHAKQLAEAKKQAEAANRAKSEFLANISHEIRTPMNAIIGFTEIITDQIREPHLREYLAAIKSSGGSLLKLINDILDLSKVEADKLEIKYASFNPTVVFKELNQLFSSKAVEKGLKIDLTIAPGLPPFIVLDETRFRQIVTNLLDNAIKFTDFGYIKTRVDYRFTSEDKKTLELLISIHDTGIGIPADDKELVFKPFEQSAKKPQGKYPGTGLGLAITQRLISMMEGAISVGDNKDGGSVFTVVFNHVKTGETPEVRQENKQNDRLKTIRFEKATILIVDDDFMNRSLIRGYLRKYDFHFEEAENGKDGVEIASICQPDLILMDMKMPVMDGYEATDLIKKNSALKDIPIIALTAFTSADSRQRIKDLCDGSLIKPISRASLVSELIKFLKYKDDHLPENDRTPGFPTDKEKQIAEKTSVNNLSTLLKFLENDITELWKKRLFLSSNEMLHFADQIKELGNTYHYPILSEWGKRIHSQSQSFLVDELENTLKELPEIISTVKSMM